MIEQINEQDEQLIQKLKSKKVSRDERMKRIQKMNNHQNQYPNNNLNNTATDINQCDRYDHNNMTFSEAIQTNYQNLSEFRQIQLRKECPQSLFQEEEQISSRDAFNCQDNNFDIGFSKQLDTQLNQNFNQIADNSQSKIAGLQIETNIQQDSQDVMNQYEQDCTEANQVAESQLEKEYYKIKYNANEQNKINYAMLSKLLSKGQIKMYKGNRKNQKVTNSKQNSQPPSHKEFNKQNPTNQLSQDTLKHPITHNPNQKEISIPLTAINSERSKQQNHSSNLQQNAQQVKIEQQSEFTQNNQLLVQNLKIKNVKKIINRNPSTVKHINHYSANAGRTSPNVICFQKIVDQFQTDVQSQNCFQNPSDNCFEQLKFIICNDEEQKCQNNEQSIENQQFTQRTNTEFNNVLDQSTKILFSNDNTKELNLKNNTITAKNYKKIRKPSHQKHNSLERNHQQKNQQQFKKQSELLQNKIILEEERIDNFIQEGCQNNQEINEALFLDQNIQTIYNESKSDQNQQKNILRNQKQIIKINDFQILKNFNNQNQQPRNNNICQKLKQNSNIMIVSNKQQHLKNFSKKNQNPNQQEAKIISKQDQSSNGRAKSQYEMDTGLKKAKMKNTINYKAEDQKGTLQENTNWKHCNSYDDTNKNQQKLRTNKDFTKNQKRDGKVNKQHKLFYETSNRISKSINSPAKQNCLIKKQPNLEVKRTDFDKNKQFATFDSQICQLQSQNLNKRLDSKPFNQQNCQKALIVNQQMQIKETQIEQQNKLFNQQILNSDTGGSGQSSNNQQYGTKINLSDQDKIVLQTQIENQKSEQVSLKCKAEQTQLDNNYKLPFSSNQDICQTTDFKYKSFDLHQNHHHQKLLNQQRLKQQQNFFKCQNQLSLKYSQSIFQKEESSSGDQIQPSASPATGEYIMNSQNCNQALAISSSTSNQVQNAQANKEQIKKLILLNQNKHIENSNQGFSENAIIYSSLNQQKEMKHKIIENECAANTVTLIKSGKTSLKSKKIGNQSIYKTEDFRSSLSKWGGGKKSSGPSGSSGTQQKFDRKGVNQEKKDFLKAEVDLVCAEDNTSNFMNKMVATARQNQKSSNFLDEFSQFEEQYELFNNNDKIKVVERRLKDEKIVKSINHINSINNELNTTQYNIHESKQNVSVSAPQKIQKLKSIIMDYDLKEQQKNKKNNVNIIYEESKVSLPQ